MRKPQEINIGETINGCLSFGRVDTKYSKDGQEIYINFCEACKYKNNHSGCAPHVKVEMKVTENTYQ